MTAQNYIASAMEAPEIIRAGRGRVAVFSRPKPHPGRVNEDCAAVIQPGGDKLLLLIADGVGGHAAGARASACVTEAVGEAVSAAGKDAPLREAILAALEQSNQTMLERRSGEATTVVIAEISGASLRAYHSGDSELMVCDERGWIKLHTVSHSPAGYAVEMEIMSEERAMYHNERNRIFNAIGLKRMHISVAYPVALERGDTVLLGTDGVFDNLYKNEIIEIVCKEKVEKAAEKLLRVVTDRMEGKEAGSPSKPDDVAFILYREG